MSAIILPGRPGWFGMVSPREEEMPEFLKLAGTGWRTPKRTWEDLWRTRRGTFNHMLGARKFALPKFQRGFISMPIGMWHDPDSGTAPNMQDITHTHAETAPVAARIQIGWDSDGSVRYYFGTEVANVVWADLTTQSDDANDHTNDWWPDQPDTNEGLNWDIRSTNETAVPAFRFYDTGGAANRNVDQWYLLDTVSNDMADAGRDGCIVCLHSGGTAKSPVSGTDLVDCDIEITGTGDASAVATTTLDLQADT